MGTRTQNHTVADADVPKWAPVLEGIRAEGLDCLQSTVAAMADQINGQGTHLVLGAELRFPSVNGAGDLGVQPDTADRLAQARQLLGFEVCQESAAASVDDLMDLAQAGSLYVVSEAYDLAWLPYARATVRYREMPHSFLLECGTDPQEFVVVDAYYADTQWGRARPGTWTFTAAGLSEAMHGVGEAYRLSATSTPRRPGLAEVVEQNARLAAGADDAISEYAETTRRGLLEAEGIERLVLDIWHLTRERLLFELWFSQHAEDIEVHGSVEGWQALATRSYLASRRALRGSPPDVGLLNQVEAQLQMDRKLVANLADRYGSLALSSAIPAAVRGATARVLGLDVASVPAEGALLSLPGFDSFGLVAIIEQVESETGLRLPEHYDGAQLATLEGLIGLFDPRQSR